MKITSAPIAGPRFKLLKAMLTLLGLVSIILSPSTANAQVNGRLGTIYTENPSLQSCVINIPVNDVNVPWVVSGYNEDGYSMVMAMTNLCTLPGNPAQCRDWQGNLNASGTAWGANSALTANENRCALNPGGRCLYFTQMDNIWNVLGDASGNIAGQPRADLVRNTTWNMDGITSSPFSRVVNYNSPVTMPVNLPSYFEWMNGRDTGGLPSMWNTNCAANSLGARFTHARFGNTNCLTTDVGSPYNFPWLRSALSGSANSTWVLTSSTSLSLNAASTVNAFGLLPAIWISSDLSISCGSFSSPGTIIPSAPPSGPLETIYTDNPSLQSCVVNIPVNDVNVPWVVSGYNEDGYTMMMSMTNLCTLPGNPAGCVNSAGNPSATGTVWNQIGGTGGNDNRCAQGAGGRCNYFNQMDNIWNVLGDDQGEIAGQPRDALVRNTTWNMDGITSSPFSRVANYNTPVTMRVNLPSYFEWMNGRDTGGLPSMWNTNCAANSLGARFTHARFGNTNCLTTDVGSPYNFPWLRSADSVGTNSTWILLNGTSNSLSTTSTSLAFGLLPSIWISSDLVVSCGTYSAPGHILPTDTIGGAPGVVVNIPVNNVDVPWVVSGYNEDDYSMVMAMTNICTLPGNPAQCRDNTGALSAFGTTWNQVGGTGTWDNRCAMGAGGRCNYFNQMDNIWNVLGDMSGAIAGQPRANVVRNTTWNMDGFTSANPAVRTVGYNQPVTMRVNLPSFFEWQNGRDTGAGNALVFSGNCAPNSLGARFTYARFGNTNCQTTNVGTPYNIPWLRSAFSGSTGNTWFLTNNTSFSLDATDAAVALGLLPAIWISSDLTFYCGSGTFADPYQLHPSYCDSAPTMTISSPTDNPWRGPNAGFNTLAVTGTVSDPDIGQVLTIQYQLNSTSGTWSQLTTVNTPADGEPYTGNIIVGGVAQGQNTVYLRVCDNAPTPACSDPIPVGFRMDMTAPVCGSIWEPSAPVPWMNADNVGTRTFTLTSSSDTDSGISAASFSCTAGATNGATCQVTITDNVGNTNLCTSPPNRIDIIPPTITINNSSTSWYNTQRQASATITDAGGSGLAGARYVEVAAGEANPFVDIDTCRSSLTPITPGSVINIPVGGTDVPWVISDYLDNGHALIMAMTNMCTLPGNPAECRDEAGNLNAWGTVWGISTTGIDDENRCAQNPGGRCLYFTQMDNIWNVMGDASGNIAGVPKADVVRNTTWNMDGITSDPLGRVVNYNTPVTMRVNLPSYYEWQNGRDTGGLPSMWNTNCAANSLGARFTHARFGTTNCLTANMDGSYNRPWLRTADSFNPAGAWILTLDTSTSLNAAGPTLAYGLLPVLWLSTSITTGNAYCGSGTFSDPFEIDPANCSSSPALVGTPYTSGANIPTSQGDRTVFFCAYDHAGNWSTGSGTYRWENVAPTCAGWTPTSPAPWQTIHTGQTFTLEGCTDEGGSGLADGSGSRPANTYTCTTGINHGDFCTLTIYDNAGNSTVFNSPINRVDTTPPTISSTNSNPGSWTNTQITGTIIATDDLSGLSSARFSWIPTGLGSNPFTSLSTCQSAGTEIPINSTTSLDSLPIGSTIQITGQGGAIYRFIKLTPFNDDGSVIPHSDGISGSYWMLADNYCALPNTPSNCLLADGGISSPPRQAWNNTNNNNWTDMVNNGTYGVWQRVLSPMLNDLPTTIGGLSRDQAVLERAFPMAPMTDNQITSTPSGCNLTTDTSVNLTACTWTGRISLPSYADWQTDISGNVGGWGQFTGTNADAFARTRTTNLGTCGSAGCSWASPPSAFNVGLNWWPWLRSPNASMANFMWNVSGGSSFSAVGNNATISIGVSPVLWLSSSLFIDDTSGAGTYASPFTIVPQASLDFSAPMGGYTLYMCASDNAGNWTTNQAEYNWEDIAPTVTQTPNPSVPSSGIYYESPTITITGSDTGGSGINAIRFSWNHVFNSDADASGGTGSADEGPVWQANNTTTTIPSAGTSILYFQAIDNAGNVSAVESVVYVLDTEAPTLDTAFISPLPTIGYNGWLLSAPVYQVAAHDAIGGNQDDTRIASIVTDLLTGMLDSDYVDMNSATNMINQPSSTVQTATFQTSDPTPRYVNINVPANGIFTAYYYATNITPLNSIIGSTTFHIDTSSPSAQLTSLTQSEDMNTVTLTYSMTDDFFDTNTGSNILSAHTSGLSTCLLQESVAVFDSNGVLGEFSEFATILSSCGTPDSANNANSAVFNESITRTLQSGRVYRYQLILTDNAGNTSTIALSDSVASNTPPRLNIFNLYQNQSAFPNTIVTITGTITDPDIGEIITVSADIGGVVRYETFTSPLSNQGFTLTWYGHEMPLGIFGNDPESLEPIIIHATDASANDPTAPINEVSVTYQGRIISRPAPEQAISNQDARDLYNQAHTRHAGALFFLSGTQPNLRDRVTGNLSFISPTFGDSANSFYCFSDTGCFNLSLDPDNPAQIWLRDITDYSTSPPITRTFPFLVQFYEQPLSLNELRINDTGW